MRRALVTLVALAALAVPAAVVAQEDAPPPTELWNEYPLEEGESQPGGAEQGASPQPGGAQQRPAQSAEGGAPRPAVRTARTSRAAAGCSSPSWLRQPWRLREWGPGFSGAAGARPVPRPWRRRRAPGARARPRSPWAATWCRRATCARHRAAWQPRCPSPSPRPSRARRRQSRPGPRGEPSATPAPRHCEDENDADARSEGATIEAACRRLGLEFGELVQDRAVGPDASPSRPGLAYALEKIADDEASCLIVSGLDRLSLSAADLGASDREPQRARARGSWWRTSTWTRPPATAGWRPGR